MIRDKVNKQGPLVIDLTGPEGNAFYILGLADQWFKQIGICDKHRKQILDHMKSDDYEHLIKVFDDYFGDFVVLER